jgi:hypothetical protein
MPERGAPIPSDCRSGRDVQIKPTHPNTLIDRISDRTLCWRAIPIDLALSAQDYLLLLSTNYQGDYDDLQAI